MAEANRSNHCHQCGNLLQEDGSFCGNCGAAVLSPPPQAEQVIPQQEAASHAPSRSRRLPWILALIGVLVTVLLVPIVLISSRASGDTELVSGVRSTLPEGWIAQDSELPGMTDLIPASYAGEEANVYSEDIASGDAVMVFHEGSGLNCSAQPDEVSTTFSQDTIVSGYDDYVQAGGTIRSGDGTVAGNPANWALNYNANTSPRILDIEIPQTSSEYPVYSSGVTLTICVEELFQTEFWVSSYPFGTPPEHSGEELTATNNASTPEVRDEAHREVERGYEENIESLLEVLENVDTDEWDGSTDLDGIPTSLDLLSEIPEDPFQGELEGTFDAAESSGRTIVGGLNPDPVEDTGTEQTSEEQYLDETTTQAETGSSAEERTKDFVFQYYDAVEREDWEATYSMLAEASQEEFTEDKWVEVQEIRQATDGAPAPLESVEIEVDETQVDPPAIITLTFQDGTTGTITLIFSLESQELRRYLTEEDISYLEGLLEEETSTSDQGLDEETAVEETLRNHYEAIGDNDFDTAYSYFGPTFSSANSETDWVSGEESSGITDSTINSIDVSEVSEDAATATVDVSFEDNSGTSHFVITWNLVKEDGEWKLDEVASSERTSPS